jgi:hypothetical protein
MENIDQSIVVMGATMGGKVVEPVELPSRVFTSDSGVIALLKLNPENEITIKNSRGTYTYSFKRI